MEFTKLILRFIFFILSLSFIVVHNSALSDQENRYSNNVIPSWVKAQSFPLETLPIKPSQANLQCLLIDTQRHWDEKTLYFHIATKILTQSGVEEISQLQIDFDPSYSHVSMHTIQIYRDGEWLDRLENSRCNLIQRESELEKKIYNGELSLIYFLDDIRKGDVIEYSYSIIGEHPILSSHYTDMVFLQRETSIEKITHRFLCHPELSFSIQAVNSSIEPNIQDLSSTLREWTWEVVETKPYSTEPNEPAWYNPIAHIEMSQYKNWKEVVEKVYPLFALPSDFSDSIPPEMQDLIIKWKNSTSKSEERALLALRFVQDQIRYFGIEEGIGGLKPTDPCVTFERRFGDCKDKGFLLHALLQLMDIPSQPLLVHSSRGKRLSNVLPMPQVFNHFVLQIEIDDKPYWVDSTITFQGGSLEKNFFPHFEWGLLVSNNSKGLIPLPQINLKNPTEIETTIILESENTAHLRKKIVYRDYYADAARHSLEKNGLKKFEEWILTSLQEKYGVVTSDFPIEVSDDRENNTLTFIESYHIQTQKRENKKILKIFSDTIENCLNKKINPERSSPSKLFFPLWIKEEIYIQNPFNQWDPLNEEINIEHESFLYKLTTQIEKNSATYNFELKNIQDHIPKHSLQEYWHMINEIIEEVPNKMIIANPSSAKK